MLPDEPAIGKKPGTIVLRSFQELFRLELKQQNKCSPRARVCGLCVWRARAYSCHTTAS